MAQHQQYTDDPLILPSEKLLRRVPHWHFIFDRNLARYRPSSAAFEDHPNGSPMSVHLGSVLAQRGLAVVSVLVGHADFALASISASVARENGQGIQRSPLPGDPAHAEVFGPKSGSVRRRLAKTAEWVVPPSTQNLGMPV